MPYWGVWIETVIWVVTKKIRAVPYGAALIFYFLYIPCRTPTSSASQIARLWRYS